MLLSNPIQPQCASLSSSFVLFKMEEETQHIFSVTFVAPFSNPWPKSGRIRTSGGTVVVDSLELVFGLQFSVDCSWTAVE